MRGAIEEDVLRRVEAPMYRAYEAGNHATVDAQPGTPGSAIARATRLHTVQNDDRSPAPPRPSREIETFPSPGRWILGQRVLAEAPEVASILTHERLTAAVETAIGAPGVISQFVAYNRTPGAEGARGRCAAA